MTPVLLDTGCIVALLDRSERNHLIVAKVIEGLTAPLMTCEAVIAESCYLLRSLRGACDAVLRNVENGTFQIPFQIDKSCAPVRTLMRKYARIPMDFADACLVQLADELGTGQILTLDSDFVVYRWRRNRSFDLLVAC